MLELSCYVKTLTYNYTRLINNTKVHIGLDGVYFLPSNTPPPFTSLPLKAHAHIEC